MGMRLGSRASARTVLFFAVALFSGCEGLDDSVLPEETGELDGLEVIESDDFEVRNGTTSTVNFLYSGEFLSVGYLARATDNKPFCTATLIQADIVMTAAHCLAGMSLSQIRFSIDPSWPAGTRAAPIRAAYYTNSSGYITLDIAILRLAKPYDQYIRAVDPAALHYGPQQTFDYISALNSLNIATNSAAVVLGYGVNSTSGSTATRRRGDVLVNGYFTDALVPTQTVLQVRPGAASAITCNGDSGGPLLVKRTTAVSTDMLATGLYPDSRRNAYVIAGVASSVRSNSSSTISTTFCAGVVSANYVPMNRYLAAVQNAIAAVRR